MAIALRAGLAAEGHGVHAVPPDDAVPVRDPDHRGLPRRGRLPAQQGRRALHEALRAERARARLARRRLPLGADRDRRGPRDQRLGLPRPAPSRRGADHRAAARLARAGDDLRGGRPDLRPDPGAAGRPLPHGRRRDRQRRRHGAAGPLRGRRGRVRLGARLEPPRRQLADGDDHLRPPGRPRRGRGRARRRGSRPGARVRRARRRARDPGSRRAHRAPSGPGRCATSSAPRCSRTSASSGRARRWRRSSRSSPASASATRASTSRTRARSSTATSPR